jgi:plasmid stabilization system protein ParE
MNIHFTSDETSADGVRQRTFLLGVPGVLWSPAAGPADGPLLLMGHGGGLHKTHPGLVSRAEYYVTSRGWMAAAIDAPGHGERPRSSADQAWVARMMAARDAGEPLAPIVTAFNDSLAVRAVPEWQAALDALQQLPDIGTSRPVGYSGMTLASTIGIPLVAADARIGAAAFGGVFAGEELLAAARSVTVPVEFILSWDDPELDRESGFAVFDAFGSADKTLVAHPGSHREVPWHVVEGSGQFFERVLG